MTPSLARFLSAGITPAAIEIGESGFAGVQLRRSRHGAGLAAAGLHDLPPRLALPDGRTEIEGLGDELATFWQAAGFRGKRVVLAVTNRTAVLLRLQLPRMPRRDLRRAVELQTREAFANPQAEAVVDFDTVPAGAYDVTTTGVTVIAAAAPRPAVDDLLRLARAAGLVVTRIDVASLALMRALQAPCTLDAGGGIARAIVDVGWSQSTLVVSRDGVPELTLVLSAGYGRGVEALVADLSFSPEQAQQARRAIGLGTPAAGELPLGADADERVAEVLAAALQPLAEELLAALDQHARDGNGAAPIELTVSGEGARTRDLAAWLAGILGLPTTLCRPLGDLAANETSLPDDVLVEMSPRLAVAMGLVCDGRGRR